MSTTDQAWIDKQGDVWRLGDDGLMHTKETRPFPREYVERKWGPLRPLATAVPEVCDARSTYPTDLRCTLPAGHAPMSNGCEHMDRNAMVGWITLGGNA